MGTCRYFKDSACWMPVLETISSNDGSRAVAKRRCVETQDSLAAVPCSVEGGDVLEQTLRASVLRTGSQGKAEAVTEIASQNRSRSIQVIDVESCSDDKT